MIDITVFFVPGNARSQIVAKAAFEGLRQIRRDVEMRPTHTYHGEPRSRIAVFYGLAGGMQNALRTYPELGRRAFYIDLGYWGRRKRTRWDGYHKISMNSRHPTAYFQNRQHPNDRFASFGIPICPWRKRGRHIIVAGMSAKAAAAEGFGPEQWERDAVRQLRKFTRRPIVYRPKPNWREAREIPGTAMQRDVPLEVALRDCHAVVTHHSNVAVDALLAGVPVFCVEGAALPLANPIEFLHNIETPTKPEGRERWAADLAYCQFTIDEMRDGSAWRILEAEGLL